ncbi:MAG: HD domain-containing protein [Desulfobacteraceae bacterium]
MVQKINTFNNEIIGTVLETIEKINHLKDVDSILDQILYKARRFSSADAGSIFIAEKDRLRFGYVHNDTLFMEDQGREAIYVDFSVPIDETSIVGYVALNREKLVIDNAYDISEDRPYSFNPDYDRKSGYKTVSMLTLPLTTLQNNLVGVMQLINARDADGDIVGFSPEIQDYLPLFSNNAAVAIERGLMNRELILRMVKMAELRDPSETGAHVQRVGAFSAEIFQEWAVKNHVDFKEMRKSRDEIRLAAMLHDVGKIGIPDHILKKPGRLTRDEFEVMKLHTVYGGQLFINDTSSFDKVSCDIALHHHEKWDGTGYPGNFSDLTRPEITTGKPLKGRDIPFYARIVALADVYDALISKRSYKTAWSEERVFDIIESESGKHFDPELVSVFFRIVPVIRAIQEKYKN